MPAASEQAVALPVEAWSVDDVCRGLENIGLQSLIPAFRENAVNGKDLLALTDDDYDLLRCSKLQAKKIRRAVAEAQASSESEEQPSAPFAPPEETPSAGQPAAPSWTPPASAAASAAPQPAQAPAAPEVFGIPPPLQQQPGAMAPPYGAPPQGYGTAAPAGYPPMQQPGSSPYAMQPQPGYGPPSMQPGYGGAPMQQQPGYYGAPAGPPVYVPYGAPGYGGVPPGYGSSNQDCSIQ